jgi:hypothetical protein
MFKKKQILRLAFFTLLGKVHFPSIYIAGLYESLNESDISWIYPDDEFISTPRS